MCLLQCKHIQGSYGWESGMVGCRGSGDGDGREVLYEYDGSRAEDFCRPSVRRMRPYRTRSIPINVRNISTNAHAAGTPTYSGFSVPSLSRLSTADRSPTVGVRVGWKTDQKRPAAGVVNGLVSASTASWFRPACTSSIPGFGLSVGTGSFTSAESKQVHKTRQIHFIIFIIFIFIIFNFNVIYF